MERPDGEFGAGIPAVEHDDGLADAVAVASDAFSISFVGAHDEADGVPTRFGGVFLLTAAAGLNSVGCGAPPIRDRLERDGSSELGDVQRLGGAQSDRGIGNSVRADSGAFRDVFGSVRANAAE